MSGLTGTELVNKTAQLLGIWDSEIQDIIPGRYYNKADTLEFVNQALKYDIFPELRNRTTLFKGTAILNNWEETDTVTSVSDNALTVQYGSFRPYCVGGKVHKSGSDFYYTITEYVNPTTVKVDGDISGWVGSEVYIFSGFFPYISENGLDDLTELKEVWTYTSPTEVKRREVDIKTEQAVYAGYKEDNFAYNTFNIVAYEKTFKSGTGRARGFMIRPHYSIKIPNALEVIYTEFPQDFGYEDTPVQIPLGHEDILAYSAALSMMGSLKLASHQQKYITSQYISKLSSLKNGYKAVSKLRFSPPPTNFKSTPNGKLLRRV